MDGDRELAAGRGLDVLGEEREVLAVRVVGRIGGRQVPLGLGRGAGAGSASDRRQRQAAALEARSRRFIAVSPFLSLVNYRRKGHLRQHHHDLREHRNDRDRGDQQKKERQGRERDGVGILARHGLQHEQVEADRRRDLGHLDDQHEEDAEPDQVEAGRA